MSVDRMAIAEKEQRTTVAERRRPLSKLVSLSRLLVAWAPAATVLGLLTVSCGSIDEVPASESDERPSVSQRLPSRLLCASDALGIPFELSVVGRHLAVIDLAADLVLHFIDRYTGRIDQSYGPRGGGPGEYRGAWSIDPDPNDQGRLYVYDFQLRRITEIQLNPSPQGVAPVATRTFGLNGGAALTGPVRTNAGEILSLGFFLDGRLGVFDDSGNLIDVNGALPPGPAGMPELIRQHAHQATLVPHPLRGRFVALPRHSTRLEYISSDAQMLAEAQGPVSIIPDFNPTAARGSRGFIMSREARFGYIDGTASEDHVYALFSGRSTKMFEERAVFGQIVHVFDWEGNFEMALDLQRDVIAIAVDPLAQTLYGVVHDPTPAIFEFALDEVVPPARPAELARTRPSPKHASVVRER